MIINYKMPICKVQDCGKRATYGKSGTKLAEYCKTHKPVEYIDVIHQHCKHTGCTIIANYGEANSKLAEYCKLHKLEGYVDVKSKKCAHENCNLRPTYGLPGKSIDFCKKHAINGYVVAKYKYCKHEGCTTRRYYGLPGKRAEFCAKHKLTNYVDVISKRCIHENCDSLSVYGAPNSSKAEYCKLHKLENYINVFSKRCKYTGCNIIPYYGLPGKSAEFCKTHALEGYIDVKNKTCMYIGGCSTIANYGNPNSKKAEYCVLHKLANYVDVKSKQCKYVDCKVQPQYGVPGYSSEFCVTHANKSIHCARPTKVKTDTYKECTICLVKIHYAIELCSNCRNFQSTGKTVKTHQKELRIKQLLEENEIKYEFHDKRITDGCTKFRPDFQIAHPSGLISIILEVDEHQHKRNTYECSCEIARMRSIYHDIGTDGYLFFIRYNPDKYLGEQKNFDRETYLIKYINNILDKSIDQFPSKLSVTYLFYDHFISTDLPEIEPVNLDGDYECEHCKEGFHTIDALKKHMLQH